MIYRNQLEPDEKPFPEPGKSCFDNRFLTTRHNRQRYPMPTVIRGGDAYQQQLLAEQTAYALGQITSSKFLPSLTRLSSGSDLLHYRVRLNEYLDADLVRELVASLESGASDMDWEQIQASCYACVIGAGVAACIDTTFGNEQLYLRYANALADQLGRARRAAEMPRSLLFLESALHEKVDVLLARVRQRMWLWLIG
jgi:hypothetical protein